MSLACEILNYEGFYSTTTMLYLRNPGLYQRVASKNNRQCSLVRALHAQVVVTFFHQVSMHAGVCSWKEEGWRIDGSGVGHSRDKYVI